MKDNGLGTLGNSVAGLLGGGAGAGTLHALGIGAAGAGDLQSIVSSVAGGGVGGAVIMATIGLIKNAMNKS